MNQSKVVIDALFFRDPLADLWSLFCFRIIVDESLRLLLSVNHRHVADLSPPQTGQLFVVG